MLHVLAAGRLGGLHQISQSAGHVLHGIDQHNLGDEDVSVKEDKIQRLYQQLYLSFLIGRSKTGRTVLDNIRELDDGGDGVLCCHRQLFLRRGGSSYKSLGVFHQSLGRLQNMFSVIYNNIVVSSVDFAFKMI